jgi:hypothetical protein
MLGLLRLRIFDATDLDISDLGEEHGHPVLRVCGKGGKVVLVPLPPGGERGVAAIEYEGVMRDLVVTENITLDGVIAPMDGWFDPGAQGEDLVAANTEHREAADALVLGRVTYEEFSAYWPTQAHDRTGISGYLNEVSKYVFSATMDRADWANTTILRGPIEDELAALKRAPGCVMR